MSIVLMLLRDFFDWRRELVRLSFEGDYSPSYDIRV